MKKTLIAAALGCAFGAIPAFAESFTDSAAVVSVHAVTERTPVNRQECWNEEHRGYEDRTVTRQDNGAPIGAGTVLGAIAGGVIGHQFGNSSGGRDRGTAAGAIVGGLVGNQVDRQNAADNGPGTETEVERRPVTREVERCRTVQEMREVPVGYDVRYRYGGREFMTRMPFDPGRRVHIAVDVNPVVEAQPAAPVYHRLFCSEVKAGDCFRERTATTLPKTIPRFRFTLYGLMPLKRVVLWKSSNIGARMRR